jgi:hypothetical protein
MKWGRVPERSEGRRWPPPLRSGLAAGARASPTAWERQSPPFSPLPHEVGEGARAQRGREGAAWETAHDDETWRAANPPPPLRSGLNGRMLAPPPLRGRGEDLSFLPSLTKWGRVPERSEVGRGQPGSPYATMKPADDVPLLGSRVSALSCSYVLSRHTWLRSISSFGCGERYDESSRICWSCRRARCWIRVTGTTIGASPAR